VLRLRSPAPDDAPDVFRVLRERDEADFGVPDCTLEDVLDEWHATDFDLDADARVCEDEHSSIIGYASVRPPGAYSATAPGHEGRGAERLLLDWSEQRQRELGWTHHRQVAAASDPVAKARLQDAGYRQVRSHWRMQKALDVEVRAPDAPAGVGLRALDPQSDAQAIYALDRESFAAVAGTPPESRREFTESHLQAHDLDPGLSVVATRGTRPIGFLLTRRWPEAPVGYIDVLAVAPEEQGRGLGRTMLQQAFVLFRQAGLSEAQLGVAADNPKALQLYESAGMAVLFQLDSYERALE
jgi:mycothiol synthase